MAYHGMKKEDIEDTSTHKQYPPARPAPSWNPFGKLPAPQRGGGGEEDSCKVQTIKIQFLLNMSDKHKKIQRYGRV